MPLVVCPDCQRDISDAAPECIFCGRPQHVAAAPPPVTPQPLPGAGSPRFRMYRERKLYPLSSTKLVLLYLCTFGLYSFYWFYRNWRVWRDSSGEMVSPFWRSVFNGIMAFSLFDRVWDQDPRNARDAGLAPVGLAAVYFVCGILYRLPDPWWLLAFGALVPLVVVQEKINEVSRMADPGVPVDDHYSPLHVAGIVVGGLLLALSVLGTFMLASP